MANVNFIKFTRKTCVNVYSVMLVLQNQLCCNKGGVSFTPIFVYAEGLYFIIIASTVHSGNEPV